MDMRTSVAADGSGSVLHALKTDIVSFAAILDGTKRFEFRRDDRGFKVGDTLKLVEVDPASGALTGRCCFVDVTYLLEGRYGVPAGYCVMSIGEPLLYAGRREK